VDQAPSDEDAQALLGFEAAYLGVLVKHGNDRVLSGPGRTCSTAGAWSTSMCRNPSDPGRAAARVPDAARRAPAAVRRADRRGRQGRRPAPRRQPLQDRRVTVNGQVVSAAQPPCRTGISQPASASLGCSGGARGHRSAPPGTVLTDDQNPGRL
jgi:hypothetical protein